MTRTAFIAIVGRPNVGKSTLMNHLLGEKVAIVSNKPQTTRTRIAGILTKGEDQFVFIDTPGVHHAKNKLGEYMMKTVRSSVGSADAVILIADAGHPAGEIEKNLIGQIKKAELPSVLVLNKIDLINSAKLAETITEYASLHDFDAVVPTCAETGKNVEEVLDEVTPFLYESDWMFDEDSLTDQPERQIASEIIREKLLRTLFDEIPHGTAVIIEDFEEDEKIIKIRAEIYCEKQSHKGIIIGKDGKKIKGIGKAARLEIEALIGTKVYLELFVKVKEHWRDSVLAISNFGYK